LTANAIGALLDWGEYVEATSEQRSNELLQRLLTPQTDRVWVHRDGVETQVPIAEVQLGDTLKASPPSSGASWTGGKSSSPMPAASAPSSSPPSSAATPPGSR
jgi:hypothetical protein